MSTHSMKRTSDQVSSATTSYSSSSDSNNKTLQQMMSAPPAYYSLPKMKSLGDSQSLAAMIASRRSGLHSLHMQFAAQMNQRRKVCFEASLPVVQQQQQQEEPSDVEPPMKRRRFQRRNSKTAAMLFSSLSSINPSDLEAECNRPEGSAATTTSEQSEAPAASSSSGESWDSGLEIAEELVRQLKLRRQSLGNNKST